MSKVKILLYCTKGKHYLHRVGVEKWWWNEGCYEPFSYKEGFEIFDKLPKTHRYKDGDCDVQIGDLLNQKIVAECECDNVEEIRMLQDNNMTYETKTLTEEQLLIKSCLEGYQLGNYLGYLYENKCGYALHLSNLKIFDEFYNVSDCTQYRKWQTRLKNAPQNMCEVYGKDGEKYVLISIQPQHLVKILNGKKTIEVRRKVLNCLKEMISNDY